jgi:hypothetical protein
MVNTQRTGPRHNREMIVFTMLLLTGEYANAGNLGHTTTMYFALRRTIMVASSSVMYQIDTKAGGMVVMS